MDIKNCSNLNVTKPLGVYKLSTSAMKDTNYVKKYSSVKRKLEGFDDE